MLCFHTALQCEPLSLADITAVPIQTISRLKVLFWPIVVCSNLPIYCGARVSDGRDSVSGACRTAATAAVNASSHDHSDERQEEKQDDEKRHLRERVGLRKTLQFGPDVLENRHHFLRSAHSDCGKSGLSFLLYSPVTLLT